MSEIEAVGMGEFRNHLDRYTQENQEPIALTSHGETIGYYIPAQTQPHKKNIGSLQQAVNKLNKMLAEKGLSEEDIVQDFQLLSKKIIDE
ncbi:MAG: prevent-host-death family protein [Crocosphaera sp.]